MKQSLSIKLGQQLKMTPQLQQAIRLLQLSTLELEQEIQDSIDGNPMLETEDDWADSPDNASADSQDDFPRARPLSRQWIQPPPRPTTMTCPAI